MIRIAILLMTSSLLLPAASWTPLFNGKNMDGWEHVGPGQFTLEDGALKTEGGMGLLWFKGEKLGNCTIRVVFKTISTPGANSGVYIRMEEPPKDPWYGVHNGYEVQIDGQADDWHATGAIYSLSKIEKRVQKPTGEWNTMEITLKGSETIVRLNGTVVNDFKQGGPVPERKQWFEPVRGPRPDSGYIGLQNHDAKSVVVFKEISVKK
jgi:hypothetical protein